ncbi:MAG: HEAT repeat domain-containing protein [Anaerolineae bacterium]|nr:HEAT repeat domain-containing protein [Anaerolineae bacterium]
MTHQDTNKPDIEGAIRLLKTADDDIRQYIAYLLGQTGDPRVIEPLIEALQDAHIGVCGATANALGSMGDPRAVPHLRPFLKHDNPQMVVWAAYALTRLGHDHFEQLTDALESDDVMVRRSAILALHQLGDERAIGPLLALQHDDSRRFQADSTVAEAVDRALISLGYNVGKLPPNA